MTSAALVPMNGESPTWLGTSSPSVEGWVISLAMASILRRLHVTHDFGFSCARRRRCRSKLAEVVPREDMIHLLATESKLVALLPINWRRYFTFRMKVIQFVWTKIKFHAVKGLILINLKNISVSISHFTIGTIIIIIIYRINHSFFFAVGIPNWNSFVISC